MAPFGPHPPRVTSRREHEGAASPCQYSGVTTVVPNRNDGVRRQSQPDRGADSVASSWDVLGWSMRRPTRSAVVAALTLVLKVFFAREEPPSPWRCMIFRTVLRLAIPPCRPRLCQSAVMSVSWVCHAEDGERPPWVTTGMS
jgi:hypothetical protein